MRKYSFLAIPVILVALALVVAGCNDTSGPPAASPPNAKSPNPGDPTAAGEHGHKPGQHGGFVVEIGRDNYHAEAIFEKNGVVRLITLGKDEARIEEVETQTLTAFARLVGSTEEAVEIEFKPNPQAGDAEGKTSRFIGTLPANLRGKAVEITVQNIRIGGNRFRFGFNTAPSEVHAAGDMPAKVADEEERKLYLTPGGKYTEADIKANGNMTASQKFKGFKAQHDLKPKPGDKICPVTLTKANPLCTWIVGGKTYEFCCPPCVDEFVSQAKDPQTAGELKEPGDYVKKAKN